MVVDTRPSVTVIGILSQLGEIWGIDIADLPDIGLRDGDEVEVTIRKRDTEEDGNDR